MFAWLAVFASPAVFRATLILERLEVPGLIDLRGFASDAAISLLVAGACIALARASRLTGVAVGFVWVLMQGANYESVAALGTPASITEVRFLFSRTFFLGSATTVTHPILVVLLLVATCGGLWRALSPESRQPWRAVFASVVGAVVALSVLGMWPWPFDVAGWRPAHALMRDARLILRNVTAPIERAGPAFPNAATAMLALTPELAADYDGEPRFPLDAEQVPRPNVLLVVVESVSGSHIDRLAAAQRRPELGLMPELDRIAGEAVAYSTFFVHQRKTNRGLYALLCGELPNLRTGLPKMSGYPEGGRTCLPRILRDAGYETRYLQAAPLAFMMKDRFMPRVGFERVNGGELFEHAYARSAWGVDDRSFFEGAARAVEELQKRRTATDAPWFLTLLSVGTHHPFVVPPDFSPPDVQTEVERTLRYADWAVGEFDRKLSDLGVFEDTLVIYTSDESLGPTRTATSLERLLGQSWGFLIARAPGSPQGLVTEPFAQMDVATSILDYLGLRVSGDHLFGRSVFRRYVVGRTIFFANSNAYFNGMLDPYGRLAMCMLDFESCRAFRPTAGRVFGPGLVEVEWDAPRDDLLQEMTRRSVNSDEGSPGSHELQLLAAPNFVADRRAFSVVHGGQYLALAPGDWVEVELVARVEGAHGARADLRHRVESREQGLLYEDTQTVAVGETLRWKYRFGAAEAVHAFGARSYARAAGPEPVTLYFDVARITLHRAEDPIESGFQLAVLESNPAN
jgi:arylsulfatase A-like enzyme